MTALSAPEALLAEVVTVTPKLAKEWLGLNLKNRRLAKSTVQGYKRDMQAGRWLLTADPIRFSEDGRLLDGQHRLAACVLADVPFVSLVAHGVSSDTMRVIDHGRPRTVADELNIEGKRWATVGAAAGRWLYIFKHGQTAIGKGRVTSSEVHDMLDRHPLLLESCGTCYGSFGVNASLLAAVHYVGGHLLGESEEADKFVAVFVSGKNFYDDDAALAWRERLIRMKETRTRIAQTTMQKGTIHAWNNFVSRIPVRAARAPDLVSFDGLDYSQL